MNKELRREILRRKSQLDTLERNWLEGKTPHIDGPTCQILKSQLTDISDEVEKCLLNLDLFDEKLKQHS